MEPARCRLHRSTATWLEFHSQLDGAVKDNGGPDKFRPAAGRVVGEICTGANGHRIGESYTSVSGAKLGVQYRRVRLIVMTCLDDAFWRQREVTALRDVEQLAKHRIRI